jgi:glycosyltransferase involved in cell wall biosynthesis
MSQPNTFPVEISLVIPLFNEEESIPELTDWIHRVCTQHAFTYEIILIDDGSTDRSWEVIRQLAQNNPAIRGISFRRNYGKSGALNVGFEAAKGRVVITMDADLQDSPEEIPGLYQLIAEEGYDLISGWKQKRYDPMSKTLPTKLFNFATRKMSGISLHDFNCGLKAYRHEVVKNIEVYGEMHRYIPVLAKWSGFKKIGEKVVQHQSRKYGSSKFGLERFVNGFLDLLSITFVTRFSKKPMHFFGAMGALVFFGGFLSALYLGVYKLYMVWGLGKEAERVTTSPFFYLALVAMILGTQLFLAGFIAELVARNAPDRNVYKIKETLGEPS